jgi:hypothetical protein
MSLKARGLSCYESPRASSHVFQACPWLKAQSGSLPSREVFPSPSMWGLEPQALGIMGFPKRVELPVRRGMLMSPGHEAVLMLQPLPSATASVFQRPWV